jgi:hypothetical protein
MLLAYALPLAGKTGEAAKAGPIGLAVIILLCIACYFLFKSMSKHLRRVRDNFPSENQPDAAKQAQQAQHDAAQPDGRDEHPGES